MNQRLIVNHVFAMLKKIHIVFLCCVLAGCGKSDAQLEAEKLCLQAAFKAESLRTKGLTALSNSPAETIALSQNDFQIKIPFKKITADDTGTASNDLSMYSAATCEVKNGKLIDGHLLGNGLIE